MIVGGRDGSVKGSAGWKGRWRAGGRCAKDKLTRASKKFIARMTRRAINGRVKQAYADLVPAYEVDTPFHKGVYASSDDF